MGLIAGRAHADVADGGVFGPASRVRRPNVPIPSDGALVLESLDFTVPVVEVRDESGTLLEGELDEVGIGTGPLWAWTPAVPLAAGTIEVTLGNPEDPTIQEVATIVVVAPFEAGAPAIQTETSALWQGTPREDACCRTPLDEAAGCFWIRQAGVIRVLPGFSSAETQAVLNQYLFRVAAAGTEPTADEPLFRPLESSHEVVFEAPADEYCIEVHALHLATQEIHVYDELEGCATHENKDVGNDIPIPLDPSSLSPEICPVPPLSHHDAWCEINGEACDDDASSYECELLKYVCDDGPLPAAWENLRELAGRVDGGGTIVLPDDPPSDGGVTSGASARDDGGSETALPDAGGDDPSDHSGDGSDGCNVGDARPRANAWALLAIAACALAWTRRRHRVR